MPGTTTANSSSNKSEVQLVSERVKKTKQEIEQLKAQLQKLIDNGINKTDHTETKPSIASLNNEHKTEPVHSLNNKINADSNKTTVPKHNTSDSRSPEKPAVPPRLTGRPKEKSPPKQVLKEESPKKIRHYDQEAAREYIKKQKEKRKEFLKNQKKEVDITHDIKKQRLNELRQKSLQLVSKNIQHSRERSRSRSRDNLDQQELNPIESKVAHEKSDVVPHSKFAQPLHKNITVRSNKRDLSAIPKLDIPRHIRFDVDNIPLVETHVDSERIEKPTSFQENTIQQNSSIKSTTTPSPSIQTNIQKITESQKHKAAVKIQAIYRGYRQRKSYQNALKIKRKIKERATKEVQTIKIEPAIPAWLQAPPNLPYPYNFINTVKRKLNLAIQQTTATNDVGVQNSMHEQKDKSDVLNKTKNTDLKSFLSHKCSNLDLKALEPLALKRNTVDEKEGSIHNPSLKFDRNGFASDSDTSKNIPEISSEESTAGKNKLRTSDADNNDVMKINTDRIKKLKLVRPKRLNFNVEGTPSHEEIIKHNGENNSNGTERASQETSHPPVRTSGELERVAKTFSDNKRKPIENIQSNEEILEHITADAGNPENLKLVSGEISERISKIYSDYKRRPHESLTLNEEISEHLTKSSSNRKMTEENYKHGEEISSIAGGRSNNRKASIQNLEEEISEHIKGNSSSDGKKSNKNLTLLSGDLSERNRSSDSKRMPHQNLNLREAIFGDIKNVGDEEWRQQTDRRKSSEEISDYLTKSSSGGRRKALKKSNKETSGSGRELSNDKITPGNKRRSNENSKSNEEISEHLSGSHSGSRRKSRSLSKSDYSGRDSIIAANKCNYMENNTKRKPKGVASSPELTQNKPELNIIPPQDTLSSFRNYMKALNGEKVLESNDSSIKTQISSLKSDEKISRTKGISPKPPSGKLDASSTQSDQLVGGAVKSNNSSETPQEYSSNFTSISSNLPLLIRPSVTLKSSRRISNANDVGDGKTGTSIIRKPNEKAAGESKGKSNEIHLKFEAELHLLNEFNDSLRQIMAMDKSLLELRNSNNQQDKSTTTYQTRDTQTSFVTKSSTDTKITTELPQQLSNKAQVQIPTVNYSRGSEISEDMDILSLNNTIAETTGLEISELKDNMLTSSKEESNVDVSLSFAKENMYKKNVYTGLSLEMFEQLIKDEDVRIENLKTILKIREKALVDRTKGELAWLEIQKKHLRDSGQLQEISAIKKKQRGLLIKLEHERHEMQRLKQMQKAASKERKSVLREQRNMIKAQLSNANTMITKIKRHTKEEPRHSGPLKVYNIRSHSESIRSETSMSRRSSVAEEIISVVSHSQSVISHVTEEAIISNEKPDLQMDMVAPAAVNPQMQTEHVKRSLLMREAALQKRRKAAEELLQWHQRLIEEEEKIAELEQAASAIINQVPMVTQSMVSDEPASEKHKFKGAQLNLLWYNMTGREEQKFNDHMTYTMSKISLERFCKDAKKYAISRNKSFSNKKSGKVSDSDSSLSAIDVTVTELTHNLKNSGSEKSKRVMPKNSEIASQIIVSKDTQDYTSDFESLLSLNIESDEDQKIPPDHLSHSKISSIDDISRSDKDIETIAEQSRNIIDYSKTNRNEENLLIDEPSSVVIIDEKSSSTNKSNLNDNKVLEFIPENVINNLTDTLNKNARNVETNQDATSNDISTDIEEDEKISEILELTSNYGQQSIISANEEFIPSLDKLPSQTIEEEIDTKNDAEIVKNVMHDKANKNKVPGELSSHHKTTNEDHSITSVATESKITEEQPTETIVNEIVSEVEEDGTSLSRTIEEQSIQTNNELLSKINRTTETNENQSIQTDINTFSGTHKNHLSNEEDQTIQTAVSSSPHENLSVCSEANENLSIQTDIDTFGQAHADPVLDSKTNEDELVQTDISVNQVHETGLHNSKTSENQSVPTNSSLIQTDESKSNEDQSIPTENLLNSTQEVNLLSSNANENQLLSSKTNEDQSIQTDNLINQIQETSLHNSKTSENRTVPTNSSLIQIGESKSNEDQSIPTENSLDVTQEVVLSSSKANENQLLSSKTNEDQSMQTDNLINQTEEGSLLNSKANEDQSIQTDVKSYTQTDEDQTKNQSTEVSENELVSGFSKINGNLGSISNEDDVFTKSHNKPNEDASTNLENETHNEARKQSQENESEIRTIETEGDTEIVSDEEWHQSNDSSDNQEPTQTHPISYPQNGLTSKEDSINTITSISEKVESPLLLSYGYVEDKRPNGENAKEDNTLNMDDISQATDYSKAESLTHSADHELEDGSNLSATAKEEPDKTKEEPEEDNIIHSPDDQIEDKSKTDLSDIPEEEISKVDLDQTYEVQSEEDCKSTANKSADASLLDEKKITPDLEYIDVKKRVSEILADANSPRGDKSPRVQDLYVTAYDVVSPEHSSSSGSPTEDIEQSFTPPHPLFVSDEVEELLKKQLEIEQEIKEIQQQQQKEHIPYLYVREIPNKPPPPYTPPVTIQTPVSGSILPATEKQIERISKLTADILHTAYSNKNLQNISLSADDLNMMQKKHGVDKNCFEFVFDLSKEAAIDHYKQFETETGPSWMCLAKRSKLAMGEPLDKNGLEKFIATKVKQWLGYEVVKLTENIKRQWSSKKRDHVDELLVIECQAEETEWTNYDRDELIVKDELTKDIMNMLLSETAQVFNNILNKKRLLS